MIGRRELLDMATRMSLTPHVVEKDYVLGWMLAGITPRVTPIRTTPASSTRSRSGAGFGQPVYIYQCPLCQKKFRRDKMDGRLNAHKNDWGGQCSGRTGYLVDTKY